MTIEGKIDRADGNVLISSRSQLNSGLALVGVKAKGGTRRWLKKAKLVGRIGL